MKRYFVTLFFLSLLLATSSLALATPAFNFTTAANNSTDGTWEFGIDFTVNSPVTVDALEYYVGGGITQAHAVGLFNSSGTLLASTTINTSSPVSGFWGVENITPITLSTGTYQLVGISGSDNYTWNDIGFTVNSNLTYLGDTYNSGTTLQYQTPGFHNDATDGFWGPNMDITSTTSVPEPTALLLLGFSLVGLAGVRKKFKN
ncbi:MAG TPA: DUF4082 domain-containing protein [Syntrophorhabdales bacterium]|nr:DUF4082 domain-containing protein [Syntrophorhabdales bacterium]